MSWGSVLRKDMDIGLVHDEYGCYLEELSSRPVPLFSLVNHRLGIAVIQQARLARMV
jgi:hypothetical protein